MKLSKQIEVQVASTGWRSILVGFSGHLSESI
jgi:hypothetical protein